jgi:hypothetical protein
VVQFGWRILRITINTAPPNSEPALPACPQSNQRFAAHGISEKLTANVVASLDDLDAGLPTRCTSQSIRVLRRCHLILAAVDHQGRTSYPPQGCVHVQVLKPMQQFVQRVETCVAAGPALLDRRQVTPQLVH